MCQAGRHLYPKVPNTWKQRGHDKKNNERFMYVVIVFESQSNPNRSPGSFSTYPPTPSEEDVEARLKPRQVGPKGVRFLHPVDLVTPGVPVTGTAPFQAQPAP